MEKERRRMYEADGGRAAEGENRGRQAKGSSIEGMRDKGKGTKRQWNPSDEE